MLTLLPLSGIQDVLKRRNSTTMDQFTDRRGSISVYDTYSLPNSKADMRRFSSYEQLAPFFQQILSQDGVASTPAPAPVPTSPSTASTTSPTVPSPLVRSRRGSIGRFASALTGSFRRPKTSPAARQPPESESDVSCDDLDAKLAEIKGKLVSVTLHWKNTTHNSHLQHSQLLSMRDNLRKPLSLLFKQAQFKSEDLDISQRVDDLSSSVDELYVSTPECWSPLGHEDRLFSELREAKMGMHRSNSFQSYRTSLSTSGLQSISENDSELGDREQSEDPEDPPARPSGQVVLRRSTPVQGSRPSSYASISEEPELDASELSGSNSKEYCLLNNTLRLGLTGRAKSLTQLPHVIRNDLSVRHVDPSDAARKRNSVISIMSDSVLVTHRHLPAMRSLLKEQEL